MPKRRWMDTNLSINGISHYVKLYDKVYERNPMAADQTFRATVGRFVDKSETDAVTDLLKAVKDRRSDK